MRLLITRPRDDAAALAAELTALGHEPSIEPVIDIQPVQRQLALGGARAILATSANGVRALAAANGRRDLTLFAVGDATAEAARAAGFAKVESADGDVEALAKLVRDRLRPGLGALLHVAGTEIAGDLAKLLEGYEIRREVLYEAKAANALSPATRDALASGKIDGVLLFSPRSARLFVTLAKEAGCAAALAGVTAYCLSRNAADAAAGAAWRRVVIADKPTKPSLLATLATTPPETARKAAPAATPMPNAPNPVVWFALAGIGALAAFAAFKPAPPTPMPDPSRIAALETRIEKMPTGVDPALVARLDRIAASLAALESRLTAAEQSGLPAELKRLADRQRALERSFADLPPPDTEATRRLTEFQSALDTALKRADERLAALEVRLGRALERPAALALAVGQLRAALQGAGSFAGEVERLATLAEGDGSISGPIRELLDLKAGVPGLAELRGRFGAVAREALRPERDAAAPIWERAWTRFTDLVSVRRVGEVVGESAEALIARAEARLAVGDLAAAVAEVERLSGAAKTSTNAWLTEAKRRLAAEAAMAALDRAIMDRMREAKK